MWLTVPVEKGRPINQTRITDQRWVSKHSKALQQAYGLDWRPGNRSTLYTIAVESTLWLAYRLKIRVPQMIRASRLTVPGTKSDLILNLCKATGADVYLSGPLGRDYLDLPAFEKAGIEVRWHDYQDPDDPPLSAVHHLFGGRNGSQQSPVSDARLELRDRRRHELQRAVDAD